MKYCGRRVLKCRVRPVAYALHWGVRFGSIDSISDRPPRLLVVIAAVWQCQCQTMSNCPEIGNISIRSHASRRIIRPHHLHHQLANAKVGPGQCWGFVRIFEYRIIDYYSNTDSNVKRTLTTGDRMPEWTDGYWDHEDKHRLCYTNKMRHLFFGFKYLPKYYMKYFMFLVR